MSVLTLFTVRVLLIAAVAVVCIAAPLGESLIKRSTLSGAPAVMGTGTYPRANKLSDGTILGVYTAFSAGDNVITTVKSTDNGASWQQLGEVARGASIANDIDNPYVLQLPTGRVLCAYRNHSKDPKTGAYTSFRITVSFSDDKGKSWKYLSTPASDDGPVLGNWEPFLRSALDGSLQIYYSRENSASDQDSLKRVSTNGGKTWSTAQTISGSDITARDGMLGVATLSGSKLIAVFETESSGVFNIMSITSADDGKTWTNRRMVYASTGTGNSAGAPQVINVGGSLVVSFQTSEDSNQGSGVGSYTSHTAAKVISSNDGGNTWGNKLTVGSEQSAWPGLLGLDKGSYLALMDHGGAKAQKITL